MSTPNVQNVFWLKAPLKPSAWSKQAPATMCPLCLQYSFLRAPVAHLTMDGDRWGGCAVLISHQRLPGFSRCGKVVVISGISKFPNSRGKNTVKVLLSSNRACQNPPPSLSDRAILSSRQTRWLAIQDCAITKGSWLPKLEGSNHPKIMSRSPGMAEGGKRHPWPLLPPIYPTACSVALQTCSFRGSALPSRRWDILFLIGYFNRLNWRV